MQSDINIEYDGLVKLHNIMTAVFWSIIFAAGISVMLYAALHKTVVIQSASAEGTQLFVAGLEGSFAGERYGLLLKNELSGGRVLNIPLERGIKAENIVIDNQYEEKKLLIYIEGGDAEFYRSNVVSGDTSNIVEALCEETGGGTVLSFGMDGIYEYRTTMTDGMMSVGIYAPHELYDMVAVLDVSAGCRSFAGEFAERYAAGDISDKVRIYYMGPDNAETSEEETEEFIKASSADIYIGIDKANAEDSALYGIYAVYNADYFIPYFGNTELADILVKDTAIAAGNRANGLYAAENEDILKKIKIPAARLYIGYVSNPKEQVLLDNAEYQKTLADGLNNAIGEIRQLWENE